jgi:hypothetical protein
MKGKLMSTVGSSACSLELSAAYFQPVSSVFLSQQISHHEQAETGHVTANQGRYALQHDE